MSINIKHPRPIPSDRAVLSQLGPHYSLHPPLEVNMNTHSFHMGGATALAAAGVPNSVIQIIGRWPRACFLRYIRLSTAIVQGHAALHDSWDIHQLIEQ